MSTIFITGGTSGIGLSLAVEFLNRGFIVGVCGRDLSKIPKEFNEKQNLLLGHTRLSIIDLSDNGNQPMLSFDKNKVIIFNGCIYNFKELANKFQIKIINSLTSDTRLLLELINKIGIKHALDEIEGMYSFALYDKIYNNIYLVNDRFGEKPIYIYFSDKHIFFSSELQAIKLLEPSRNFSIDKLSIN